jgi:hypothetical protein
MKKPFRRSPGMNGKAMLFGTLIGRGVFKALALICAFVLIIATWLWAPRC